jgi:hypothetical protein
MKKTLITAAAVAMSAGLVGVAAAASGDSSAREQAPAVPSSQPSPFDDRGRGAEPGDDHGSAGHGADDVPAPAASSVVVGPGHDVGDDRGGRGAEPGDDRGSGGSGADDPVSHDLGDDRGGRGAEPGDDHGSGGHGGDD